MKSAKEIIEIIISFDLFLQEKKFKKSKSVFSYILFVYLFFACMFILPADYRFFHFLPNIMVSLMTKILDAFYFYS